jgi:hypothetical protein
MTSSTVSVGQVAERTDRLENRCSRCDRRGVLLMPRLLREMGPKSPGWKA